jgi:uncharacterized protein
MLSHLSAVALAAALSGAGHAAPGFDCAKASDAIERAVCADGKLAEADRALARIYPATLARLSAGARGQVRESQRQWVRYLRAACDPAQYDMKLDAQTFRNCLSSEYSDRLEILDASAKTEGGRRLFYVSRYKSAKSQDQDFFRRWNTLAATYPQIDAATSASDRKLNRVLAAMAARAVSGFDPEDDTDISFEMKVSARTPSMISFEVTDYSYSHGAAHGNAALSMYHWLTGPGRELAARDVFSQSSGWQEFLRAFCAHEVAHFGFVHSPAELQGQVEEPSNWVFEKAGLGIHFDPYAVASYADGMQEVVVPWDKLKGYLAKDAMRVLGRP